jgi:hypothetical protein
MAAIEREMSQGPNTRMERQVRNQARVLFWVSALLLVTCASMTGTFGWSLGRSFYEKFIYTMGFVVADIGGAGLMAVSGTCAANRATKAAVGAMAVAMLCCTLTLLGIAGFQAENRESQVAARKKAIGLADATIDWFKTVTKDLTQQGKTIKGGSTPTEAMALGFDAVGRAVREQQDRLLSGEVTAAVDGQSALIARLTGTTEETARSWTTAFTTIALLVIQYSCLWYYGFLRHKIEPAVGALAHGPVGARRPVKSGQLRDNVVKATFEQACQDVETNVNAGIELCNREYAGRWGVSEPKACRWAKAIVRQGIAEQQWRGQRKVLVKCRKGFRVLDGGAVK